MEWFQLSRLLISCISALGLSVYAERIWAFFKGGERIDCPRRTGCEAVYVLVLHFSPENRSEGAAIAWTHKFSPSPRPRIRILNECRMFGNKRGEGERARERECGETSKGEDAKIFFFQAMQKSLFKIGSGVAECESGRENACGIGIRLMSNKKQGVWVSCGEEIMEGRGEMWRGRADNYGAKPTVWLRLTLDCNLPSPRDLFPLSHALCWLKACHYVLAKQSVGFIVLMCMCPGAGHVEKVVWVKERGWGFLR